MIFPPTLTDLSAAGLRRRYDLPNKIFAARDSTGRTLAATIKGEFTNGKWSTWQQLEDIFGVELDRLTPSGQPWSPAGRLQPATQFGLNLLCETLIARYPYFAEIDGEIAQLTRADAVANTPTTADLYVKNSSRLKLTPRDACWKFPDAREPLALYPEQDPAVRQLMLKWFHNNGKTNHILIPGGTGCGKTIIALAGIVRAMREYNQHLPPSTFPLPLVYPIHIITVPNAEEQWNREAERAGLADELGKSIHIYGYNSVSSSTLIGRMTDEKIIIPEIEEDPFADPDAVAAAPKPRRVISYLPHAVGRIFIIDECHKLANHDTLITSTINNLKDLLSSCPWLDTKSLWLSATPFEKVNDAKTFVTFADIRFGGSKVTRKNFHINFASALANGKPDVVTAASMERLFGAIKDNVIEIPYVPWDYKSINSVWITDFETGRDREYVAGCWDQHLERMSKLGKDGPTGVGAAFASLTVFRAAVEHVRIPQVVRAMNQDNLNGFDAGCSAQYTATIIKGVFDLIDNYGYTRDDISIIWGGRANVEPEKILSSEDQFQLLKESMESGQPLSKATYKLLKMNLEWQKDKLIFNDKTDADQQRRWERFKALGLIGTQTKQQRQFEIDKFQSGKAKFVFYTMASGGTGLSLPHYNSQQRPRRGYHSPIYSGKDFTQGFGRFPRRNSISDTVQRCVLLNGTVESEHVAPILDNKLKSASAFTSKKTDIMMALANLFSTREDVKFQRTFTAAQVRSGEQAASDAYNDERTQSHAVVCTDDDDNDNDND